MTMCYAVPGLAGTELFTDAALTQKVWVDYTQLALGNLRYLRLAPDGVSPAPPWGQVMYPGGPLPDYYGQAIAGLSAALGPHGYTVVPWGYDFRLSTRTTGPQLAARIRQDVTPADPCSIVGHSLGGIVARLAWADLVRTGDTGLVRRIVTLGTPHWGSYGAVRVWSLDAEPVDQLSYLSLVSAGIFGAALAGAQGRIFFFADVAALFSTWPSVYETLPSLLAPDAASDPNRASIYTRPFPSDRGVSAALLADAMNVYQPLLATASTMPPSWVLTTVGGEGYPTVSGLTFPQLLGTDGAYTARSSGDGQVVVSSAELPASAVIRLNGTHGDLPLITAGFSGAADVILEVRTPPGPPPATQQLPGIFPWKLHGPPIPVGYTPWRDC